MIRALKDAADILENAGYTKELLALEDLIFFLEDIPETILFADMRANPWMVELVILSDRIVNAVNRDTLERLKSG